MSTKKYNKDICIKLLIDKDQLLKEQEITRYLKRADFTQEEVVAIKAYLGPWPRALEIAGLKPLRPQKEKKEKVKKIKDIKES